MRENKIDVKVLRDIPPWEWPEGAGKMFLDILRGGQPAEADRLLAAELAGDFTVINDELADALLSILRSGDESEALRGQAAISLGPMLEQADMDGFEEAAGVPKDVRRRILDAAVRAPQDWHREAVRAAYGSDDEVWRLTAVFCMRFVRGFDEQILEALDSRNPDIHYEAVCAAGAWEVDAAWPHIAALVTSEETDKPLLLAAIEAVASIRPREAAEILDDLTDSDDEPRH